MKPGWKTTEFWLSVAAVFVGAMLAAGIFPEAGIISKSLGVVAGVLGAMGYTVSRSWLKASANNDSAAQAIASANPTQPAKP